MISENIQIWFSRYMLPIDDPGSRLFHWNVLAALSLVFAWAIFSFGLSSGGQTFRKSIFRFKYWWNRSTRRDYFFFITNSLFKVFLFIPLLDISFQVARFVSSTLYDLNGDFLSLKPSYGAIVAFTIFSFVWDDFLRFLQHFFMHHIPFLWKFHSVHHSAKILTPITLYRAHPFESAFATLRNGVSLGLSAGLFIFLFRSQMSVWTIAGVNVFGFLFNFLGANLRHSHIPLSFGFLEKIFISPLQHQVHHSSHKDHFDKNLGVSLAIWDLMVGSWMSSSGISKLKFGLGNFQSRSLWQEYGFPKLNLDFIKSYKTKWKSPVDSLPNGVSSEPIFQTEVVPRKVF